MPVHPWQSARDGVAKQQQQVYPSDGTLPLPEYRRVKRATLLVDSRDRDYAKYPSPSEYVVYLPVPLMNVSNAVLISAELPSTYYVFSSAMGNTTLRVSVSGTYANITIPDGNYTFATMASALTAALTAAFPTVTFTVQFDPATARLSITALGIPLAVDCTAATKPTGWGLGYYLGFQRGVVTSGTGTVTGTNIGNMNPEMYMLVDIKELNAVQQAAMYGEGGSMGRVFAKVPICHSTFQHSFYDKTLTCNEVRPPIAKVDRLTIAIRFHDGTPVDFHGAAHSLTIELTHTGRFTRDSRPRTTRANLPFCLLLRVVADRMMASTFLVLSRSWCMGT